MFRENNFCASCLCSYNTQFDAGKFTKLAKTLLPQLNDKDVFARSGLFIQAEARDCVSSFKCLGSSVCEGSRIELIQVRLQRDIEIQDAFDTVVEMLCRHILETHSDAIFAAVTTDAENRWQTVLIRSPRFCTFEIPADILNYMTVKLLDKYLIKNCMVSQADLDMCFADELVLGDGSALRNRARIIDAALKSVKFCDPAVGNGQLSFAMANLVVKRRLALNRFFVHKIERTEQRFMRHFAEQCLFVTDCDPAAVEAFKLELKLNLAGDFDTGNIVWGNILLENTFGRRQFDILLSDPPHLKQDYFFFIKKELTDFKADAVNADIYCYYIERSVNLLKQGGTAVFLTSNRWMRADYGKGIREFLSGKEINEIIDYGNIPALDGSVMPMSLITVENSPSSGKPVKFVATDTETSISNVSAFAEKNRQYVDVSILSSNRWSSADSSIHQLLEKIASQGVPLEEYAGKKNIFRGLLTGCNKAFTMSCEQAEKIIAKDAKYKELLKPFLSGRNVKRYTKPAVKKYLICIPRGFTDRHRGRMDATDWFAENYFELALHLSQFQEIAEHRHDKGDYWWEMRSFKHYDALAKPKIICPTIVSKISVTMDKGGLYSNDKTSLIIAKDYYLLGLLNSKMMDFYFRQKTGELLNGYYELKPADLSRLPVKKVIRTNKFNTRLQQRIAECAYELQAIYESGNKLLDSKKRQKAIAIERELDACVTRLYKLTRAEIKITENF